MAPPRKKVSPFGVIFLLFVKKKVCIKRVTFIGTEASGGQVFVSVTSSNPGESRRNLQMSASASLSWRAYWEITPTLSRSRYVKSLVDRNVWLLIGYKSDE